MTISDINSILTDYRIRREKVQQELDNIDMMMDHWVTQRETLKGSKVSLFDEMFGGNPVDNIPSVHYTYTDTPMAEEYYGG